MSHSFDNTLLQRMGFSDPDRRTPAHDLACIKIASEPERFASHVKPPVFAAREHTCALEMPLQKGDGKYATTVGFIDAFLTWSSACLGWICAGCNGYHQCTCKQDQIVGPRQIYWQTASMLVEVKTRIDSIGDLLRQMNLYREYKKADTYAVWSLDPKDETFTKLLAGQGYTLVTGPVLG